MLKEHNLFPTPVIEYKWEDVEEMNKGLLEHLYGMEDVFDSPERQSYSMVGGTHTGFQLFTHENPHVQEFYRRISEMVYEWGKKYIDPNFDQTYAMSTNLTPWAMIYGPDDYSKMHTHPGIELSMTYYVRVPETIGRNGNLEIYDPRPGASFDWYYQNQESTLVSLEPKEGGGFMFPGWLPHGTTPHRGEGDRVCIVVNAKVHTPQGKTY
jgi:uncharacterized protein (TIGR02466 family)